MVEARRLVLRQRAAAGAANAIVVAKMSMNDVISRR